MKLCTCGHPSAWHEAGKTLDDDGQCYACNCRKFEEDVPDEDEKED